MVKGCTKHVPICSKRFWNDSERSWDDSTLPNATFVLHNLQKIPPCQSCFNLLQSLHKAPANSTLYCRACPRTPVWNDPDENLTCFWNKCDKSLNFKNITYYTLLHCTTKPAETTSKHFFVPHDLHKAPLLLCTTQIGQTESQNCFALESLHRKYPSSTTTTTSCYMTCRKHIPALCTNNKSLSNLLSQSDITLEALETSLTWRRNTLSNTTWLPNSQKVCPSPVRQFQ